MADSNLTEATKMSAIGPSIKAKGETSKQLEEEKTKGFQKLEKSHGKEMEFKRELQDTSQSVQEYLMEKTIVGGEGTLGQEELDAQKAANDATASAASADLELQQEVQRINNLKNQTITSTVKGLGEILEYSKVVDSTGQVTYNPALKQSYYLENMPTLYDDMLSANGGNQTAAGLGMYYLGRKVGLNDPRDINDYRDNVWLAPLSDEEKVIAGQEWQTTNNIWGDAMNDAEGNPLTDGWMDADEYRALVSQQGVYKPYEKRVGELTNKLESMKEYNPIIYEELNDNEGFMSRVINMFETSEETKALTQEEIKKQKEKDKENKRKWNRE